MSHNRQKKIAVINDLCGFGRCSLTVSMPIISAMGIQCCPVPTAVFSNHTGFESYRSVDLTPHLDGYLEEWAKLDLRFSGILSGYLGSARQVDIVGRFFERFRDERTVIVVDPVMGDHGRLYDACSPALAERMAGLIPYADLLTPNLTEACILAGADYRPDSDQAALTAICETLSALGPKKIVVSGLERGDNLENFVFEAGRPPVSVLVRRVGAVRSGTGDVFSAILAADAVNGVPLADSVRRASAFIAKALRRTVELDLPGTDGVCFEEFLPELGGTAS